MIAIALPETSIQLPWFGVEAKTMFFPSGDQSGIVAQRVGFPFWCVDTTSTLDATPAPVSGFMSVR